MDEEDEIKKNVPFPNQEEQPIPGANGENDANRSAMNDEPNPQGDELPSRVQYLVLDQIDNAINHGMNSLRNFFYDRRLNRVYAERINGVKK